MQGEYGAAEHDPDQHPATPVEPQAAPPDPADQLGIAAGDAESPVEQQPAGDDAQAERRTGEVPGKLRMEHPRILWTLTSPNGN